MTNEQLERAKDIKNNLELAKRELDRIKRCADKISAICFYGIKSDCAADEVIHLNKEEMDSLLVTMRNRLENCIAKLEKEFAEL